MTGEPRVGGVEVRIPREMLAGGLVLVDTPGIGGLGSAHAAASLAAISLADAVLFVTSAAQELTRSEIDFLRRARSLCPTVACVLTKTDFYPAWRRIRDLDAPHLAAEGDIPLLAVSSALRARAVKNSDAELNTESGFPDLVTLVREQVGGSAEQRLAAEAAAEVAALCDHLESSFAAERTALADPATAQRVVDELTAVKSHVERLKTAAAKWNQTLSDGVGDLTSDIDFDLRARIKEVTAEADTAIEAGDPADTWAELGPWLQARTADELLANYELLRERATELSERVGEHFREAAGTMFTRPTVHDPTPLAAGEVGEDLDLKKMRAVKQAMVALKSAYGGAMMFTLLGSMVGVILGPIGIGIGLVLGHRGLREEKKRQVQKRRTEARNAVRRYCDKVTFVASKDSRDTLRRVQRELRDHYTALAEELNRSNARALTAASEAAKRTQTDREQRLKDVDAELARIAQLAAARPGGGCRVTPPRPHPDRARPRDRRLPGHAARRAARRHPRPARPAAAGGRRRPGQGRQVHPAQRARRGTARADRRGRVHPHRHLVPGRAHLPGAGAGRPGAAAAAVRPATDGQLDIDLGGLRAEDVDELVVTWPAQALRSVTLVDTPGIGSLSESAARRTWDLLVPDEEETPADAVLYLMRHLHAGDVEFLRAFHDSEVSRPSPVNAIGVLSRADEIAVGRLDSMASARRIATRLGEDPNVRRLVQSVVPVAGLLAETAVTLTEEEVGQLRRIADLPPTRGRGAAAVGRPVRVDQAGAGPDRRWNGSRCWPGSACSGCGWRARCCAAAWPPPPPSWPGSWPSAAASTSCRRCSARCSSSGATC